VSLSADAALTRAEWQGYLFSARPVRRELLSLVPPWSTRAIGLRVHRNHAFESVASVLSRYLAFAGISAELAVLETVLGRTIQPGEQVRQLQEERWDSVKHIEVLFMVEEELGLTFDAEEIAALESLTAIVDHAERRLHPH